MSGYRDETTALAHENEALRRENEALRQKLDGDERANEARGPRRTGAHFAWLVAGVAAATALATGAVILRVKPSNVSFSAPDYSVVSVVVRDEGDIRVNGASVPRWELVAHLRSLQQTNASLRVIVYASPSLPAERITEVTDRVRNAGFTRVSVQSGEP
ncbi:MAG: hypothetical protein U0269_17290 [Polyangiales bacterium]